VVHIQFNWTRKIFAAAAGSLLVLSFAAAQTVNDEGKRKLKTKSGVTYPELARRMNISGKVRIEVVIAPDGRVRSARVVGGHPVLVQSCLEAVKDWKYEPASEETTQIVEFEFKGQQ
jgi:protein TonB